jgi:nucleotide-binding universal stress UspA family protein
MEEDAASGSTYEVRFKRILVPTDFSEGAEQALKYAVRFNGVYHAEIFLLHVFNLPEYVSPLSAKAAVDSEVADEVLEVAKKRALENSNFRLKATLTLSLCQLTSGPD